MSATHARSWLNASVWVSSSWVMCSSMRETDDLLLPGVQALEERGGDRGPFELQARTLAHRLAEEPAVGHAGLGRDMPSRAVGRSGAVIRTPSNSLAGGAPYARSVAPVRVTRIPRSRGSAEWPSTIPANSQFDA
jgi:hypothetical protein